MNKFRSSFFPAQPMYNNRHLPDFARLPDLPEQILHVYEAEIGLFSLHSFRVDIDLPTILHSEYRKI